MKRLNLNRREKYTVTGLVCFIVILLVFKLMIYPPLDKRERLSRVLAEKTIELKEIRALQSEYYTLHNKANIARTALDKRSKDFSLFSYLDSLVGEIDIKENLTRIKPSTSSDKKVSTVDLKLQAITMEQLSKFLYRIEYSGNNLYVKRMSISEKSKPEGYIDVVLQVETIEV